MKIYNPTLSKSIEILDFVFNCQNVGKDIQIDDILTYFKESERYLSRSIDYLISTKLLIKENDFVKISENNFNKIRNNEITFEILLKEKIVSIKPFVEYISKIREKKDKMEVSELVKFMYDIDEKATVIQKTFDNWIKFCEIKLEPYEHKIEVIEQLQKSLSNRIDASSFLKSFFDDIYIYISQQVLDDIIDSMLLVSTSTLDAVTDAGRALEDFLRVDLVGSIISLGGVSGIGQISNEMNRHGTSFPKKLNNIVLMLGNVRNMGDAHGIDRDIGLRWNITEEYALNYILNVISVMKSYITYREKNLLSI